MLELPQQGYSYTWFNERFGTQAIQQQLDRDLVLIEWRYCFLRAQPIHESLVESNYRSLILLLDLSLGSHNFLFALKLIGYFIIDI